MTAKPSSAIVAERHPYFLDSEEHPDWQTVFANRQPLQLEIGFGRGDFLIAMAAREPSQNFIGIDFYHEGFQELMARVETLRLDNIRVVHGDAHKKIPALFLTGELKTIYINFPDPWPKKRHEKRRLIQPGLIQLLSQKLAPKGRVSIATDSEPYAREIIKYFNAEPFFQNRHPEPGFLLSRSDLPKTQFEKSFIYAGDPVHYLEFSRLSVAGKPEALDEQTPHTIENAGLTEGDEWLIKKFENAEALANDACDLRTVADNLADAGDREWAKRVYQKTEDRAEDSLDLNWLAISLLEKLGDTDWARKVYLKAEEKAASNLDCNWLAYSLAEILGDKNWARKLYKKAENLPGNTREWCDLANSIAETLGDVEWEKSIYKKAETEAIDPSDFFELADSICEKLGDKGWAKKLYEETENRVEDWCDLLSLAESLCQKLGEKNWARKVYRKAEAKATREEERRELADSLRENLGDA